MAEIFEDAKTMFDMYQIMRHRFAWDKAGNPPERDWRTMSQVNFDEPLKYGIYDLLTISKKPDGDY